jgi:hypothetical protein
MCCISGAHPGKIARSETKVMGHWWRAVHFLRNTLPKSTVDCDPTESTLSFMEVEHKYAIKWSFNFFSDDHSYYIPLKRCAECCCLRDPQPAWPTCSRSRSHIVGIEHPEIVDISIERNIITQAEKSQQTTYHTV